MAVKLDSGGILDMLKSDEVREAIDTIADAVAGNVNEVAHDGPVEVKVSSYTTDRAAAAVTMAHPGGLGIEATRGSLARAASEAGLEVKSKVA